MLAILAAMPAAGRAATGASISTDQTDYRPGATVTLTGAGWQSGEPVSIEVNDTSGGTWFYATKVTAGSSGAFTTSFQLSSSFVASYLVTATGPLSGTATTTFADHAAELEQCQNGGVGMTPEPCKREGKTFENWVNGNVNEQKAHWAEDEFLSYRSVIEGVKAGAHTLLISFDTVFSGKHAIDYLGSFDGTETTGEPTTLHADKSNPCGDVLTGFGECVPGSPVGKLAIPSPTEESGFKNCATSAGSAPTPITGFDTGRFMKIWGPSGTTITGMKYGPEVESGTGKCSRTLTIEFSVGGSEPSNKVVLAWGGHIARGAGFNGWGKGDGASSVSGSPYHMALETLDGASQGAQDRALAAGAVIPASTITIIKKAENETTGEKPTFGYTTTGGGGLPPTFTITTSAGKGEQVNEGIVPGTYTVNESTKPSGWSFTSLECTTTGGASFSKSAAEASITIPNTGGATVTCTYTNTKAQPEITTKALTPVSVGEGIHDTATLSNLFETDGTGTVTFKAYSDSKCTTQVFTTTSSFDKDGEVTSENFTPTSAGTYYWIAEYSGDSHNKAVVTKCGDANESSTVLAPHIEVEKTADASSVSAGSNIGFTVTIKNSGAGTATGVKLADALPAGNTLSPVSWSIDGSTGNPGSFEITGSAGGQELILKGQPVSLASGASLVVHVTASTSSTSCATYNNKAEVTTGNDGSAEAKASEEVKCAHIEVEKTADASSVSAGSNIGFTVTIKNSGAGTATGVKLADALPAGNSGSPVSWTIDGATGNPGSFEITGSAGAQSLILKNQPISLAPGASLTVHVTASASSTSCASYNNAAEVTTTNDGSAEAKASEEVKCAHIEVEKTADASSVSAGSNIGFTVTIKNSGAGTATGVELADKLPGGNTLSPVSWSISPANSSFEIKGSAGSQELVLKGQPVSLAAGASLSVHVTASTSSTSCATYNNKAEVTTTNDGSAEASAEEKVLCAHIEVEKTADASSVSAGSPIGFTVTIKNSGAGTATGLTLKDPLPAGNTGHAVSWAIDGATGNPGSFEITGTTGTQSLVLKGQPVSLAPGASLSVHVTAATFSTSCATYDNTAEVTTTNDGSAEAKASEEVLCAEIEVKKTADASSVSAGSPIGFTVTITNKGAGTATGVELSDKLPAGNALSPVSWSISPANSSFEIKGSAGSQELVLKGQPVSLAPGASLSVHVTAATSSTSCASYNNKAEVTTTNDGSAEASAEEKVLCAKIEVEKAADASSVSAGSPIGFTVTIKNSGAGTATGVELADKLPGGNTLSPVSWSISPANSSFEITGPAGSQELVLKGQPVSLAAGASLSVHVTAATTSTSCATYNNAAEVTTTNNGSAEAKASEEVKCAHIEVEKTADASSVSAGSPIGFTVTIKNSGAGTATGVELADKLPAGNALSPVSWSISPANSSFEVTGSAGAQSLILKNQPISLAPGASLSVHVTASTTSTSCATYNNKAEVTTTNDGSAEASAEEKVLCAKIEVEKTADASSVSAGSPIGFTVTIVNKGAGTATGVELKDALPAGNTLTPVSWSISPANSSFEITGTTGAQSLILKGQPVSLAPGASLSVHVTASTSSTSCASYNNKAEVTTGNDGSAEASAEEKVLCAHIEVEKTADASSVSAGSNIGFTVTIKNSGAGTATGVKLADALPAGNSGSPVSWSISPANSSFEITGSAGSQSLILKGQPVSLAPGASLTVHVTASTSSTSCASYNNKAEVTTGNDGSAEAKASEEVKCAHIEVEKTADASSVLAGSPIGFTVTITNKGAGTATGVTLTDSLPAGNSGNPVTWSIDGTTGNPASFEITGAAGSQKLILKGQPEVSLAPGKSLTVHVTTPTSGASCGVTYNNTAEATTANDGSGKASASEHVICTPKISTKATPAVTLGAKIKDTATLSGLVNADGSGKVTFKLYSDSECKTTPLFESTAPSSGGISANGDVTSGEYAPTATGTYYWVASYSGDPNNEVAVSGCKDAEESSVVGEHPGITVVKEQQIAGSGQPFTTAPLSATVGQQINYRITVTNTGDVSLALSFSDPHCDAGTITGPTGSLNPDGTLPPGGVAQYFCSHVLQASDSPQFTNVATVSGQPPSGPPVSGTSSVVANVAQQAVKAVCTVSEGSIRLHGVSGSRRQPFTVRISALGIKQITFYLDKHKLKTLTHAQAKHGRFTITIDPRRLSYGAHTVSIKAIMNDANCAKLARAGRFVHPRPPVIKPKFTG